MKEDEVEQLMTNQEDANGCVNYEGKKLYPLLALFDQTFQIIPFKSINISVPIPLSIFLHSFCKTRHGILKRLPRHPIVKDRWLFICLWTVHTMSLIPCAHLMCSSLRAQLDYYSIRWQDRLTSTNCSLFSFAPLLVYSNNKCDCTIHLSIKTCD